MIATRLPVNENFCLCIRADGSPFATFTESARLLKKLGLVSAIVTQNVSLSEARRLEAAKLLEDAR